MSRRGHVVNKQGPHLLRATGHNDVFLALGGVAFPWGLCRVGPSAHGSHPSSVPCIPGGTQEQRSQGGHQGRRRSLVASFHPRALIEHRLHAAAPPGGSCVRKRQTSKSVAWATMDRWRGPQGHRQRWEQPSPEMGSLGRGGGHGREGPRAARPTRGEPSDVSPTCPQV